MNTLLPEVAVNPTEDGRKPERFSFSQGEDVFLIVTDDNGDQVQYDLDSVKSAQYTESSVMQDTFVHRINYLVLVYKNKPSAFIEGEVPDIKKAVVLINDICSRRNVS